MCIRDRLYGASNRDELLASLDRLVPAAGYPLFIEELVWIAEGRTAFVWEGVNRKLSGEHIHVRLHWSAAPGHEQDVYKRQIEEFREAPPRDRMEYLLEYAMSLPPLPDRYQAQRDSMEQVHECQTPVFLATEINDDGVYFYLDIPLESPTVRGYAAILVEGLTGASPEAVLATPEDVYMLLGLHEVITPQRERGLHALLGYMKKQVKNRL